MCNLGLKKKENSRFHPHKSLKCVSKSPSKMWPLLSYISKRPAPFSEPSRSQNSIIKLTSHLYELNNYNFPLSPYTLSDKVLAVPACVAESLSKLVNKMMYDSRLVYYPEIMLTPRSRVLWTIIYCSAC